MRNNIYLLLLSLCFSISIGAAPRDCMIIHMQSGENLVFMLEEEPQIIFTEHGFDIGLRSLQLSDVVKYTFGDSEHLPEGLSNVVVESDIKIRNGFVVIGRNHANDKLRLYTNLGQEITVIPTFTNADGIIVDLNQLPVGMYLLNIGSETLKIMHQ